jgi:hypothetical protein
MGLADLLCYLEDKLLDVLGHLIPLFFADLGTLLLNRAAFSNGSA